MYDRCGCWYSTMSQDMQKRLLSLVGVGLRGITVAAKVGERGLLDWRYGVTTRKGRVAVSGGPCGGIRTKLAEGRYEGRRRQWYERWLSHTGIFRV